jgi:iron-sulfur cluster assembly protein
MLTVTGKAKEQIRLASEKENENRAVRLSVRGGGCSGFLYDFSYSNRGPNDFFIDDVIIVDPISMQYLKGSTVDFEDSLNGKGFKVTNPNAKGTCGCGQSFT